MILELTDMAPTGEAIGRLDGMVVFVPYALPGETVEVEIVHRRRTFARGRVVGIVRSSSHRVQPPCPYFTVCGGCEWQHIEASQQLLYKSQAVKEQLSHIGKLPDCVVQPCMAGPLVYGYRNHTQLAFSPNGALGYRRAGSWQVVEISQCLLVDSHLNELISEINYIGTPLRHHLEQIIAEHSPGDLRELHLRYGVHTAEWQVMVEWQDNQHSVVDGQIPVHEHIGGYEYVISPGSFFQVNTHVASLLVTEVLNALALQGDESVLELYSGVGLLTVPISKLASSVLGVELNPEAVQDARLNLATRSNAQVIQTDVNSAPGLPEVRSTRWSAIVVDPPRSGIPYGTLMKLLELQVPRLVYVSCDPASLARDAHVLSTAGYELTHVQPLDMFPQTHHIEIVAVFTRQVGFALHAGRP